MSKTNYSRRQSSSLVPQFIAKTKAERAADSAASISRIIHAIRHPYSKLHGAGLEQQQGPQVQMKKVVLPQKVLSVKGRETFTRNANTGMVRLSVYTPEELEKARDRVSKKSRLKLIELIAKGESIE